MRLVARKVVVAVACDHSNTAAGWLTLSRTLPIFQHTYGARWSRVRPFSTIGFFRCSVRNTSASILKARQGRLKSTRRRCQRTRLSRRRRPHPPAVRSGCSMDARRRSYSTRSAPAALSRHRSSPERSCSVCKLDHLKKIITF